MITDSLIQAFLTTAGALIGLLPDMPSDVVGASGGWKFITAFDYLIPISEFILFLPVLAVCFSALSIWRIVRAFLPGG
jgi:hypothetical protein